MESAHEGNLPSLAILNHPPSRLPGPELLHQLVPKYAERNGASAIEYRSPDGSRSLLSYEKVHEYSDSLAASISAAVQPLPTHEPFIVPILAPQGPHLYLALLSVLKAGGAFCPLNLDAPPERVKFILKDVSARLVLCTSEIASRIPQDGPQIPILVLNKDGFQAQTQARAVELARLPQPADLAYVMYTSGSTGTPKGVGVSHSAATQSLLAHDRHIPAFSRFLQFAAPTFDVSVFEIFFPLFRGKTLVSCSRPEMLNDLPAVIRDMDVDACELTPTVAGSLLRKRENAPGLRLLLTIGEMLTNPVVEEFGGGDEDKPSMLWAMYGPTEAAIHCSLQPAFSRASRVGNIGIPLDTVSAFILRIPESGNSDAEPPHVLSVGEVGELAVGGFQLASGYLNRPDQTAAAFIDSPYGPLYRTGDKARILPDGTMECVGRISDGQVKLRGQRIELGEVEQAALRTPGCHSALAAVISSILVLFCGVDGVDNLQARIQESCRSWLPAFMVPGDIVLMDEFPQLPSGKADRKRLVADYEEARDKDQQSVGAAQFEDDLERELCQITSQTLGIEANPSTNLPMAGLDSIAAIKLASSLRQGGFGISAVDILGSRTISHLRATLRHREHEKELSLEANNSNNNKMEGVIDLDQDLIGTIPALEGRFGDVEGVFLCTPLQISMLGETILNPRAYCNSVEIAVPGHFPEESIRLWISQLAKMNEVLRTGFVYHGGQFVQVLWKALEATQVSVVDELDSRFEIEVESGLLHPLRVQISPPLENGQRRLLFHIHHALYDGWTVDMLLADINRLSKLEDIETRPQFREVLAYFGSDDYSEKCDAARGFWAENLAGYQPSPFPQLSATRLESGLTASEEIVISVDPAEVRTIFRELEFGPQVLFQAALVWLWSSLVGNEDVVVGAVTSGRTIPVSRIEEIMGPCIAPVPLRADISRVRTVKDLLATIHAANRSALPHSVLPLSEIQKTCGILPGQALYDVLFVYQESLYSQSRQEQEIREICHRDVIETKLLLEVEPREGSVACRLTYRLDAFPEQHARIFMEQLQCVMHHLLQNLDQELSSIRAAFPTNLVSLYNTNPKTLSGIPDLAMAVEAVVLASSEKTAVCFAHAISEDSMDSEMISFQHLNQLGNQIARQLQDNGASLGSVVAIVMEKSILLYAGILGIVKAGCSYLPLLPSTPAARVETIFSQAGVGLCLTDTETYPKLKQLPSCRPIDLQERGFRDHDNSNLKIPADPSRIANIIYTSGSTGVPKGVCVTQLNITSNLDVLSRIYPVPGDSRLLQSCSQAFDVSVFEIFFAWTRGMCLCSAVNDTLFEDLERSIRKLEITHLSMTPTVASLVEPANIPSVEFLVTSGEPMTGAVAQRWSKQLYQGYGPSETTNICTVKKMSQADIIQHLGWSFENTSAIVLHKDASDAVPYGCVGELCFGGDQVAQGYLKLPELTSSKFIDHPEFGRLYRSGDLGRMLPDGSLVILGRVDDQIKLRGQRIELDEISGAVRQSGEVSDCITLVVNRGDSTADQLASFYVFDSGTEDPPRLEPLQLDDRLKAVNARLFQLLSSKVPTYMVPAFLIPISKVPLTAAGKLDRGWLRRTFRHLEQAYLEAASSSVDMAPADGQWTEYERRVADAVCSSLSVRQDDIQRWTPFTSLGLDSISAIGLSRRLQQQLNKRIPVSVILQNSCVTRLAKTLEMTGEPDRDSVAINLKTFSDEFESGIRSRCEGLGKRVERILPCTPLQEGMLASSASRGSYLNKMLFSLRSEPELIKRCWGLMCERHGILRTCFASTNDTRHAIAQVVFADWQPRWHSIDSSGGTIDDCVSRHAASIGEAIDSMEPAVSFAIITHEAQTYLSFICHHALYDAVAVEQLLLEVEELVHGHTLPPAPPLEPFLREVLTPSSTREGFWKEQLAGLEPLQLPQIESGNTENRQEILSCQVDMPLSEVNERSREVGFSLLALCQAAWASVLGAILHSDDVCFGNVVSGRSVPVDGINELVAPCFNTIPVRMRLSETRRNIDLMKVFQKLNPMILEHQFTPLRFIQSLVPRRGNRRLFDTILLLQQHSRPLDEEIWALERDDGEMDVPLVCEFIPDTHKDKLSIKLHYEPCNVSNTMIILISDLLRHSVDLCLNFPASHVPVAPNLPTAFVSRLSEFKPQRAESTEVTATQQIEGDNWSEMELQVRLILSKLSSVPESSIRHQTTIYQLGLDSINAVQIASLLRERGLAISASDVIEHNTSQQLALHMTTKQATPPRQTYDLIDFQNRVRPQLASFEIPSDAVEAVLPCTSLQAGMLVQFIRSGGQDYFNFIGLRLSGSHRLSSLDDAWAVLTRTHPILRTGFVPIHDKDAPFAMLQYSADSKPPPVLAVEDGHLSSFNLEKWRLDAAAACMQQLHEPPWQAVCMDGEDGLLVHLAIHHALYDAHALRRLLDDLARVWSGISLSASPRTEEVVLDILEQVQSQASNHEGFWKEQAKNMVVNKFPVLTPLREETRAILVESMTSNLPFSDIEKSIRASGSTMQAAIQATWTRILSSYLGESSVTFGTVLSGRNSEATKDAVFPCITTVPVIAQNDASNRRLLDAMLRWSADLYKQQHVPLTQIQRWVGHPDTRLFDTLLVYQRFSPSTEVSSSWNIVDDLSNIDYPVSIEIEPGQGNRLEYHITFFSDILPQPQAGLLLEQFDATLCSLVTFPDGHESDLFESVPRLFSVTPAQEPSLPSEERFLHQFVESQARKTANKTALRFVHDFDGLHPLDRTWAYRDLDENGNRVAQMLLPYVKVGDIVAVYFDKCPEAFFAILGILKAGCAFVALDPNAPAARKEFILRDSSASVLLTSAERRASMDWIASAPVLTVGEDTLRLQSCHSVHLQRELLPSDVCYCLYTSGTTGTPKGCEITHENAVQAILAFQELFAGRWDETSNWLQFASFHFDVAVLEQYWSWSVGITLVAAPRDLILGDLAGVISRLEITHIDLTPSLARLLHPDEVPTLCKGVFITGGEQLKQEILDKWGEKGAIYNAYGPTEATIGVTTYPRVPKNGRSSNIGRQFVNVGSYVFKPESEMPVLRGAVGELCVSGKLVGKGYLNRGDLTAERFPTLARFGERVYRTGDLVRILHDGCFDFLGRADDQVKLRGQRLEIGEINHTIRSGVGEVTDVATLVVRNEKQEKDLLVSFVVAVGHLQNGEKREKSTLHVITGLGAVELGKRVQDCCREKVPGYMVPTYVLQLPYIPLSSNNKAEVKELKKLFNSMDPALLISAGSTTQAAASGGRLSSTGERILKVLASMESIDLHHHAGPSTSIFELGIDSISVMRFSIALRREGLPQSTPTIILKHPRLGDLADALDSHTASAHSNSESAARQLIQACHHRHRAHVLKELGLEPGQVEYIAPCSPLQEGMISRSRMPGVGSAYFNAFRFELSDGASISNLRMAWQRVSDACAVLRTCFVETTDGHVQVALTPAPVLWTELSVKPDEDLESVLGAYRESWIETNRHNISQPFDLLSVETSDKVLLVVHIFHGLYDANSFELMLDRVIGEYYDTERIDYGPRFLDGLVRGPLRSYSSCKSFWVDHLQGASSQPFPQLSANPIPQPTSCARDIPFEKLDVVRLSLGVTHQSVIQAIWVSVIQQILSNSGSIGLITSGRSIDLEGSENIIGPLFNTVPFRASVSGDSETWSSLIGKCHDFNVAILPFQHVPLRDIQKWCSAGKPLFDTLFSFQRMAARTGHERTLWKEKESTVDPDFPLAFEATLTSDNRLRLLLVAQGGIADSDVLSNLLDQVEEAAENVANDPSRPVTQNGKEIQVGVPCEAISVGQNQEAKEDVAFVWTPTADLIREQLGVLAQVPPENIAATTPLLELGLDSIDSIKLSTRLRKAGLNLTTSQLMKGQTISGLVRQLREQPRTSTNGHVVTNGTSKSSRLSTDLEGFLSRIGFDMGAVERALPVTPLQDSMVAEMIQSDFHHYFNHDILELESDVDLDRLKAAWETVVENSPILRTSFISIESSDFNTAFCQVVEKTASLPIGEFRLTSVSDLPDVIDYARRRACKTAGRSNLVQLAFATVDTQRYLVLSIAHALYDGWSLSLLHADVQAAYNGSYVSRPSYEDHLGEIVASSSPEAQGFWSGFLGGAPATVIPSKTPESKDLRSANINRAEASSSIPLSRIKAFCRQMAISPHILGQACWAALLATRARSLDVTFGVVLSGRETELAETLMFPTMNTVAMRSVLHGDVCGWLQYMQENMASIAQFQHFPLRTAQRLAGATGGPLFNSLFIHQRQLDPAANGGKQLMKSVDGSSAVDYPVCVEMEAGEACMIWRVACDSDHLAEGDPGLLLHQLDAVMKHLISSPTADVLTFDGDEISVCGLSPFRLIMSPSSQNGVAESNNADGDESLEWSEKEGQIRAVLAELSAIPAQSIRRWHSVYHLGLDSISAIKASFLLRKKGISLNARQILGANSITEMSELASTPPAEINGKHHGGDGVGFAPSVGDVDVAAVLAANGLDASLFEGVLPATPMQVHMLSAWQNTSGQVFYPEFRYLLRGVGDLDTIFSAWQTLVRENPILRTSFVATASQGLPFIQMVHRPGSEPTNNVMEGANGTGRGLGHSRQPFVSLQAKSRGGSQWGLKLAIHHALYDGVSLPIIMERFRVLLCQSKYPSRDASHDQTWKRLLSLQTMDAERERRRSFWVEYLRGARTTPFPAIPASALPKQSKASVRRTAQLTRSAIADVSNLQSTCLDKGISLQALFFAAFAKFLAAESGPDDDDGDVVLGIYVANRHLVDGMDDLPYPTLCMVPLRVRRPRRGSSDLVAAAGEVHRDVRLISSDARLLVGLWEIGAWTGVRVDCFVNFLSLPPVERAGGAVGLEVEEVDGAGMEGVDGQMNGEGESIGVAGALGELAISENRVRGAYPNAVDIEVAIRGLSMDIGVFGPGELVGPEGAEAIVSGVTGILRGLG